MQDFTRLAGAALLMLLVTGCYLVLAPFMSALIWALILAISLGPVHEWLLDRRHLGSGAAAALLTALMAALLLLPVLMIVPSLTELVSWLAERAGEAFDQGLPSPPSWLAQLPLVGEDLLRYWQTFENDGSRLVAELKKYLGPLRDLLLAAGAGLGQGILHLALSLAMLFFMLRDGTRWAAKLRAVTAHLIGPRAGRLLRVAQQTIGSVVYGILGTSLAQAGLAWFGFWIAGVNNALFLGFLTFFLSFIPLGPALLWIPAAIGLYKAGAVGWAVFLAVWGALAVGGADNVLRPLLIGRGVDLPFLFVFLGVLGGAFAFGLTGVFIGPTLLALAYTLVRELTEGRRAEMATNAEAQAGEEASR